ncbi:hypothetical protein AMTRI_Chr05g67360 [Amborella trichopoda]
MSKQRAEVVEWLNALFDHLILPSETSEEDLRACLIDGTILCGILNKLSPSSITKVNSRSGSFGADESCLSAYERSENIKSFLSAVDVLGLPKFEPSHLEQGPITTVVDCLLTLKDHFTHEGKCEDLSQKGWVLPEAETCVVGDARQGDQSQRRNYSSLRNDRRRSYSDLQFENILRSPVMSEPTSAWLHHVGQKFHEVFQLNQSHSDLSSARSLGMMNLNSLDNAPTQSLLSLVSAILGEKQNGEIPPRVEILLRKVMQEIERRLSTQGEHIKKLKNSLREVLSREERLVSRASVLETLASGSNEEIQIVTDQLQKIKAEKVKIEEERKLGEKDLLRLMKEKDGVESAISTLKQELKATRKKYEEQCTQLETQGREAQVKLQERLKEVEEQLTESRKRVEELEAFSESKIQRWNKKEISYEKFLACQLQALQEMKLSSKSAKQEILIAKKSWREEFINLGGKLKGLASAAEKYHVVLEENRKLYNEVQDLKGNIRVYCRVRPFLPGQVEKQTTVEYIGENGELLIVNRSKQGRDGQRMFKFNKVFGPTATQEEIFLDTRPLVRSVLDGYNVCIFAYGQTGSGKTFTMTGPDMSSEEHWGVNYRALNDLFHISRSRKDTYVYEVGAQMVEIYNEQVRDLLINDGSQKRYPSAGHSFYYLYVVNIVNFDLHTLGIWTTSQPNGLAVPDASMHTVESTADVIELMQIGLMNRAIGATALNERSSRSHSVLTVHVRGLDLKTGAALRGSLHLVDLAGSERVDRSEATGDRLKEAQHINKSLSALGDVISALAQKSSHVPYRNSKLTQILQSSLGGQAKTLMFVQLNPDVESYSETISTLKFAERVSGVELGAAKSSKESKDIRDLMEQVVSLKEVLARKDAEIERLQTLRDLKFQPLDPYLTGDKRSMSTGKLTLSPGRPSIGAGLHKNRKAGSGRPVGPLDSVKAASDIDNCSEYSDRNSEAGSQQSLEDFKHLKDFDGQAKYDTGGEREQSVRTGDVDLLGFGEADSEERLSDISDGGLSMGTETDGSISSVVEFTLFPDASKPVDNSEKRLKVPSRVPRPPMKPGQTASARVPSKLSTKNASSSRRASTDQAHSSSSKSSKRWQ